MNNIKEAKNTTEFENKQKAYGFYHYTNDAKALEHWIWQLPDELKELGFKKIKKYRGDKSYVQAEFSIEPAYDLVGPYQKQLYQDLFDELLPIAEKAFSCYLNDENFENWENSDESTKEATLKDIITKRGKYKVDYWEALKHYVNRHPKELAIFSKYIYYPDSSNPDQPLYVAWTKDDRNASSKYIRNTLLTLKCTLERTTDDICYYNIEFGKDRWQGTTASELEADWDDFLVSFGNCLGA